MADEVSRRDLLRKFPALFRKSAERAREAMAGEQAAAAKPELTGPRLPAWGELLDGLPAVHPWLVIAHAAVEHLSRRYPYLLLMGASGEAFRIAYDPEDPGGAAARASVNTFLAALAVTGVAARATHGGPFEPALGGVEVTIGKGLLVVVATADGPGVVHRVDREARKVAWSTVRDGRRESSFEEFDVLWEAGAWMNGPAPWLRVTLEKGGDPRPLDQVAKVGVEAMRMVLTAEPKEGPRQGLQAIEALAADLRHGRPTAEQAEVLFGDFLATFAAGRMAAGMFLDAIGRAIDPEEREGIEAAARRYGEIHAPPPTEGVWGTGVLPEFAECVLADGRPDPTCLADEARRNRAADLLLRIRDLEREALGAADKS
jgi:hypothetical protein